MWAYFNFHGIYMAFFLSLMVFYAYANPSSIRPSLENTKEMDTVGEALTQRVQIKGDTLVIQDASCEANSKTLLQSLQTKDSKNETKLQECNDSKE